MNTNEIKDTANSEKGQDPNTVGTVDFKPCFTTSNALVFTNLHNAAAEKAAQVVGMSSGASQINQFIINTGMSDDGRTISNPNEKMNSRIRFSGNGKFEVGIVLQVNATPIALAQEGGDPEEMKKKNEKAIENAKKLIFKGLKEYFNWFCGESRFGEGDLVEFIPDYDGGKVKVDDGQIVGIKEYEAYKEEFVPAGTGHATKVTKYKEKEIDPKKKLRIGYKVGYTILYDK